MKILIAIGVLRQQEAGAAGVALNHARELQKRGHSVDSWFLDDVLPNATGAGRFDALAFAHRVAKKILDDRQKYDVVNLHAPWGCIYGLRRRFFRPQGAPPYVFTMQGSEERTVFTMSREYRVGRARNFSWKNRWWHRLYHQRMYDYSIRTADYGAVANREAWAMAQITHGRDPGCVWYVPNGTEECFFVQRDYGTQESPRLLFVGSWIDRKGIYYLAEAFGLLCRAMPEVTLSIAGCMATEDVVKNSFAQEFRDRVRVIPFVKRQDMPALYAAHDVFVFPSLVEGMPLTLLEAMATGMAIVTTEAPGMADVIEDEFNGLLVQPADAQGLAAASERLCRSAELRRQFGQEAQRIARRYTWTIVTQKLERVLQLAERRGAAGAGKRDHGND
ncbi:MAG: glycosyltransferase family 4 protein [Candidatus Acidiferrales bacterium]